MTAALTPGQRIDLIRESATLLSKFDYAELDLILEQHGLPTTDYPGEWEGTRGYAIAMLKSAADDPALRALHSYLTAGAEGGPGDSPFEGTGVRVFLSHLASRREFIGAVESRLASYGVQAFVAHDAIQPSKEWQDVIEQGLRDADVMAVFLHAGFKESNWCDQEVGWAIGRRIPVLPLAIDEMPYGFLGKFQAHKCKGQHAVLVGDAIAVWLAATTTVRARMAESLSAAFRESVSWDFTRRLVPLLETVSNFTPEQLARLEEAARDNVDVRECNVRTGLTGPEWVQQFVAERRESVVPAWATQPDF